MYYYLTRYKGDWNKYIDYSIYAFLIITIWPDIKGIETNQQNTFIPSSCWITIWPDIKGIETTTINVIPLSSITIWPDIKGIETIKVLSLENGYSLLFDPI